MRVTIFWIGCLATLCLSGPAPAAEEPLWEIGIGVGATSLPDYRGADQGHTYLLPIPYLVYRGDLFKVDRGGVHSDLARSDDLLLDISLGLGPPVKSSDNHAREGMPNLLPTFEVGPSLQWRLYRNEKRDRDLTLLLPVRAVMTARLDYIGWVFSPNLNMDFLNIGPGGGWNFGIAVGPLYAGQKYHDYYYEVLPQFATATRPAFDASGGFSGARLTVALSKRFPKFWVGAFARYDDLTHAAFVDSPLVRRDHSFMAGFGVSWIFAQSEKRVTVDDRVSGP